MTWETEIGGGLQKPRGRQAGLQPWQGKKPFSL